ncbi:MAG: U32 family peptidase [Bdellovibrionaceae bacterium]|nr:U32 family peptidase [Pseudobdellovibrionaceae bacterium]
MKATDFELLLPVGQKEMAEAAIQNGADAIYVGFPGFNARGRSYDFELEELNQIIQMCHLNGVKVNLAFNIVIFENELPVVIESIKKVLPLKPDALIVQDLGLVKIIKDMCPEQVIHASTQMTVTNDLAIQLLENLDIKRFVLGRENSLSEIKLIAERTKKELEVFVHGALCVSYSGQCFTSETLGGRSANRGQCAQSCRFSYDLIVDGETKNLIDKTYLVSPKDLCGIGEIPELMKLGVKSFKVEGRLKTPEYVAQVAKSFRSAIDRAAEKDALSTEQIQTEKNKMGVEYSRGFFPGWLHGVNHQELVDGTFGSHRGVEIGHVVLAQKNIMTIELNANYLEIENGDGLLWFDGPQKQGASIYAVEKGKNKIKIEFANSVQLRNSVVGSLVYLNHDKSQKKEIEKSLTDKNTFKKIPVKVSIVLAEGQPLAAMVQDDRFSVQMYSEGALSRAQNKPLNTEMLFSEFSALGGTVFKLDREWFQATSNAEVPLFLNHKDIKGLRQKLFSELKRLRTENKIDSASVIAIKDSGVSSQPIAPVAHTKIGLNVLLRNKEQVADLVDALLTGMLHAQQIKSVCLDFEFGRDYQSSVEKIRAVGVSVGIATTRILKPQEYINLKLIHSMKPDFILVRNLGALYYFKNIQLFSGLLKGDFSLNVTNHKTFEYLINSGLDSICLSYDLNLEQTKSVLRNIPAEKAEITIHQSMPSFHMEHCVFAAFLSKGKSYRDCGKPCEKHKVQLKDQFGHHHWIKPDHECRNTMYNASAQTALPYFNEWRELGLGEIRYEALHERGTELLKKIRSYVDVVEGQKTIREALIELQTTEVYGLSPRQLSRSDEYQARKKDHSFL